MKIYILVWRAPPLSVIEPWHAGAMYCLCIICISMKINEDDIWYVRMKMIFDMYVWRVSTSAVCSRVLACRCDVYVMGIWMEMNEENLPYLCMEFAQLSCLPWSWHVGATCTKYTHKWQYMKRIYQLYAWTSHNSAVCSGVLACRCNVHRTYI